ncbi:hypothetical protein ABOZ73_08900 [Caulobacter sp. 73W]|uniref:Bacterial Ig-like domain-containing protein n=1 Tax=Caulobacter sp. 73W TaxID=3161137 RepID=A0AB39KYC0_9CAUL
MAAVQSIDLPSNGTYTRLEMLTFDVNFDSDISISSGVPRLRLQVGAQEIDAQYLGVTGASTLSFQYHVLAGAFDGDGITVLGLTGNVVDQDGDPADLSLGGLLGDTSGILVDAVIPQVQSIVRASSAAEITNASSVAFTVTFSRDVVNVSAGDFEVGGAATGDISVSGSGSVYTVTVSNISGAGALRLDLKSAANIDIQDAVGNPYLMPMPFTTGEPYLVDKNAPAVTSVAAPSALTYGAGAELSFVVNFDEAVTVTGNPQLSLTIGSSTVQAAYASGSGTTALSFRYTVVSGQLDADGVTVGALGLNGGSIRDAAGNAATLTLNSVGSTSGVLVDAYVPLEVESIDGPDADTYAVGQTLEFKVTFNGDVEVAGAPRIALTIGGDTRYATYASGDGSDTLTFTYEVQSGDSDANGIATASTIELNGGSIKKHGSNRDVDRDLPAISGLSSVLVDGVAPEVSDIVRVGSATPTNATSVQYTVTFSEVVTGVDLTDFTLTSNGDATGDIAVTGSGSSYTVTASNITAEGSLGLNLKGSGTGIVDAHGNAIATGIVYGQEHIIDTTPPAPPTFNVVAADDVISASEVSGLTITGATELDTTVSLTIGGQVRAATVTGTNWSYSVTASDLTNMGAGTETLKIVAKDAAGNASLVETLSISVENAAVPVDDTAPPTPQPSTQEQLKAALTDAEVMARFSQSISSVRSVKEHLGVDGGLNVHVNLGQATARFLEGITSKEEFEKEITKAVLPTTGVAHSVYKYFTGSPPTEAGMEYLIDSAANPNDLTDPYYQKFSVENRFINFAVNLGKEGEGRAKFEADYGALTFSEAVSKAYGEIIGFNNAANFGVDIEKALTYIESQRAYFETLGGDPIGAKAAMIGYVISVSHSQEVGEYHQSLLFSIGAKLTGVTGSGAGFSPMGDWDLI